MNIKELMNTKTKNIICIDILTDHIKTYNTFEEGALFIVSNEKKLIAIMTDGDVRKYLSSKNMNIMDFISFNPIAVQDDMSVTEALLIFRENKINILPIVDNNLMFIGSITLHKLLNSLSPERLYIKDTNIINENHNELKHISRYHFAKNFILDNSLILDCACGSGYGTKIISENSLNTTGIDLSHDAIKFAKQFNQTNNIFFEQKDISKLSFKISSLDVVVSIETLEHIPYKVFKDFLKNIKQWLKKGGIFIASSPMLRFKNGKPYVTNPYHINEMPKETLLNDINSILDDFIIHYYYQDGNKFLPLNSESSGFCIIVARKK